LTLAGNDRRMMTPSLQQVVKDEIGQE